MQLLGIVLILINVGAIATPIVGVVLMHSNDLSELIIPPEVEEIIHNFLKSNVDRAFTTKSIIDRVFSEGLPEIPRDLVEKSLENLVKDGKFI